MTEEKEREKFLYDVTNEQVVLSAAIADEGARKKLVRSLSASEFLVPDHSQIWRVLLDITNRGLAYEPATVRQLLKQEGFPDKSFHYLESLEEEARVPSNLDHHVETLGWDATRARILKEPIPALIDTLRDPKAAPAESASAARSITRALELRSPRRHIKREAEHRRAYMAEIRARREKRNIYPIGHKPFDDKLTEGFMPGKVTVMAGLPGAGKSTVAIAWAILLSKLGRRVTYCCWEMSAESVTDVAVAHLTGIKLRKIVQGNLSNEEFGKVARAVQWFSSNVRLIENPFFDEARKGKKQSNERNMDVLEGYIAEGGGGVWFFDLWERMLVETYPSDVTRALVRQQEMHKEYQIHGIIVHQLNLKDVEKRSDKRPTRDAIKGSGAYVEVADLIFGVHRVAQFKAVPDRTVETINLKQRKGETNWSIAWEWDGSTCRVDAPREVAFNPGVDDIGTDGDIGSIDEISSGGSKRRRRRE